MWSRYHLRDLLDPALHRERWGRVHERLRRHALLLTMGAAIITLAAVVGILTGLTGRAEPLAVQQVYFYDLNTGLLFSAAHREVPPIPAPSGPLAPQGGAAGVRAHVFGCGGCSDPEQLVTGYLSTFSPSAWAALVAGSAKPAAGPRHDATDIDPIRDQLIRAPGEDRWYPLTSPQAEQIQMTVRRQCAPPLEMVECFPQ